MIDIIGYIGAIAFGVCAAPQAWKCYRERCATGISGLFLTLWLIGEICMMIYTVAEIGWINPLMLNYVANLFFLIVIIRFKVKPSILAL
jgi:uncharacterized protein with PQ loop repeat